MGLAILFVCSVASLAGGAACVAGLARHGRRALTRALLAGLGGVAVWSLAVLVMGLAEGVYSIASPVAWLLAVAGVGAVAFIASGVAAAATPRLPPGHCRRCGYNMNGVSSATVCPECGTAAPPC